MIKLLIKQPPFLFGITVLILLLVGSFAYEPFIEPTLPEPVKVLYDENKYPYDNVPFEPSLQYPFGSDLEGKNYIYSILQGAKYTIGLAIIISVARVFVSILASIIIYLLPQRFFQFFKGISDAYHYAPISLFGYFLVAPALVVFSWTYSDAVKITLLATVAILLAFPIITIYLVNEMYQLKQNEFIQASELLGANRLRIIVKHYSAHLKPKIVVVFIQQVGQVLTLFAHLGLFEIFIGGMKKLVMDYDDYGNPILKTFTLGNEWGGLIAIHWNEIISSPWLVFGPVAAFALVILCVNLIIAGINNVNGIDVQKQVKVEAVAANITNLDRTGFQFIQQGHDISSLKEKEG
ncbi:ABC transporter permease subunit [Bacillus sp. NEB1478]|uniref:ABC transporter permease subunit n=1 Tax=Bacillus sp. NEB1478 TaxID=3073816 RepID=UPI0028736AB7|nr:ABC transporter permease subunit [Bacillus sp. NEB1478]WNB92371.1 ABC transporter permease subunit [Bacillus sp. NEB1478]